MTTINEKSPSSEESHPAASKAEVTEREKWLKEIHFRHQELANATRSLDLKEREFEYTRIENSKSRWRSPLVLTIIAATVAATGNAFVAAVNGYQNREIEAQRAEQARILEMIKTGDPDSAAINLSFLLVD